jgi:hypothetical protein
MILRLILLFLLGLMGRSIYRALKFPGNAGRSRPPKTSEGSTESRTSRTSQVMDDLTEQEISDADFEEIP